MQYMHENLRMQTICGGKVQYPHYDLNPHYLWKAKMLIHISNKEHFNLMTLLKLSKEINFFKLWTKIKIKIKK
jgi:hypothetical protein